MAAGIIHYDISTDDGFQSHPSRLPFKVKGARSSTRPFLIFTIKVGILSMFEKEDEPCILARDRYRSVTNH